MQWAALLGGGLILACQYFANLPYSIYAKSDFWLNSPAQVLTKHGRDSVMLALAFLWTRYGAKEGGVGCGSSGRLRCWSTGCTSSWFTAALRGF